MNRLAQYRKPDQDKAPRGVDHDFVPLSSAKVTKAALALIATGATAEDLESLKVLAVSKANETEV